MPEKVFQGYYAGHPIRFCFEHLTTHYYFGDYLCEIRDNDYDIHVPPELYEYAEAFLPESSRPGYIEYRACIGLTSKHLLQWDCSIFHAMSFIWRGRAWLLTGPSGIGKTTQFHNWQRLYPGEAEVISGDMPVLERKEMAVFVHPSSWNGKENYHGDHSARLGGIIILEQGEMNGFRESEIGPDLITVFEQMLVTPETEQELRNLSDLVEAMFSVPVLRFANLGDDYSTEMLRQQLSYIVDSEERSNSLAVINN